MGIVLKNRQSGEVNIVDVSGRLTINDRASTLRDWIRDLARGGQKQILLNLGDVTFVDSSGLGVLASSFATVSGHGGQLKLLNVTKRVKDLLLITRLYTVFEVYEDESAAVRSFQVTGAI